MEKLIKENLKNMMINKIYFYLSIILFFLPLFIKAQVKIEADFNSDDVKDILLYECSPSKNTLGQPYCRVKIINGKSNKKHEFILYYVGYPIIDTCGDGCISLYDDAKDTEYTQEYIYMEKYDNWILTKDEVLYNYKNGKIENTLPKDYLEGINGEKYPKIECSSKLKNGKRK